MKQHPVPQNITSYKFRLVGDMTLKQFLELLGGVLVAYLFFASNLIFFIKWPLVIFSAFSGVALAFFPIEERPLDEWAINFIKSIYSPTRYIWKKTGKTPEPLTYKKSTQKNPKKSQAQKATKKQPLQTPASFQEEEVSTQEKTRLQKVTSLLDQLPTSAPSSAPAPDQTQKRPHPKVSPRKLTPQDQTTVYKSQKPTPTKPKKSSEAQTPDTKSSGPKTKDSQKDQEETIIFKKPTVSKKQSGQAKKEASLAKNMPLKPEDPNIVVGMVTDKNGKLAEDTIVEINNQEGVPQRAVKTNKLGQFFISTPLQEGQYTIHIDDKELNIPPRKLKVKDEIIPPLHLHPDKPKNSN